MTSAPQNAFPDQLGAACQQVFWECQLAVWSDEDTLQLPRQATDTNNQIH